MSFSSQPSDLEQELQVLRQELAELRSVQTMHQEAREGLRMLELQLAGIIHSAMDGIITIDGEHRVVLFNAAAEKIFACSSDQAIGKPLDQFIPASLRDVHRDHIREFAESGVINRGMRSYREVAGVRATGEEFFLEASISQVQRSGKKWFTVILRDITERKNQEGRIAQLGKILDDSVNEIYVYDGDSWRFQLVNQAARLNTGYSIEALSGMGPLDLMPEMIPEQLAHLVKPLKLGLRRTIEFTTTQRRKDGTTYPVEVRLQYLPDNKEGLFVAITLDVTERRAAERELKEVRRTFSTLLANLPGMVYRSRNVEPSTFEFISPNCLELTGYSLDDFLRENSVSYGRDVIVPEDQARVWEEVQEGLRKKRTFQIAYRIKTADGTLKWVWEQGCGVFSETGEVAALEGYITDITMERTLEDQLRKTERLAELGTLASGMAHEIGTPMNVILGRAELLMRKAKDESTRKGLETIVTQVERITKIMNQLLSFARKRPAERRGVDLRKVVTDVLDVLQEKFKKQTIRVKRNESPSLPNVWADPDQMNQVLLNLILNACQAMPSGGILSLSLRPVGNRVELKVQDDGCGMAREEIEKIFYPFFTTKAVGEGTGLGLTVVHGIIQEHDGDIRVTSAPAQGATFTVTLPVAPE